MVNFELKGSWKEKQLKGDASLSWIILLTWEISGLFGCSLTLFSLKSIDNLTSWMHYYSEKTTFFIDQRNHLYISCKLENTNPERSFLKCQTYNLLRKKNVHQQPNQSSFHICLPLKFRRAYSGDWALKNLQRNKSPSFIWNHRII